MVEAGIVVQGNLRVVVEPRVDCGLGFRQDEMVRSGNVQHQRIGDLVRLVQHLVDHHPVIADRCVDIGARGDHIGKATTKAVSGAADLCHALGADPLDGRFDIVDAIGGVILLEIAKSLLQFGLDIRVQLNPRGPGANRQKMSGAIAR